MPLDEDHDEITGNPADAGGHAGEAPTLVTAAVGAARDAADAATAATVDRADSVLSSTADAVAKNPLRSLLIVAAGAAVGGFLVGVFAKR